jgi:secreted trypsin-like serine protease
VWTKEPGVHIRLITATVATGLLGLLATSGAASAVVGGTAVPSAPWSAAVFADGVFGCSGTIVSAEYVLTARHCVQAGRQMSVRVGSTRYASGGATRTVTATSTRNDLALMKLSSPVTTTYVTLATTDPAVGDTNTIVGWGRTCASGCSFSATLQTATVTVTGTAAQDLRQGPGILTDAVSNRTGYSWKGDSGGPQFAGTVQVGVASQATGQVPARDASGRPQKAQQIYASVAANRAWIRSVTGV